MTPSATNGWNDCPPPHDGTAKVPEGAAHGVHLTGVSRQAKRGQRVFHGALAAWLKKHGGHTARTMSGKLGWFVLRYTDVEFQQVLQSARRFEVIETPESPNFDEPVVGNVQLADNGKKLTAPRGASLLDLGNSGVRATVLMWSVFGGAEKPVTVAAGLIGPPAALVGAWFLLHRWWVVALLLLAWLALVLLLGASGERALKAAALAWPRMRYYRPCRYAWETHAWRHWFFPVVEWVTAALVAGALLLGLPWAFALGPAAAVVALIGVVMYRRRVRPLREAWIEEAGQVYGCRQAGRPDLAVTAGGAQNEVVG